MTTEMIPVRLVPGALYAFDGIRATEAQRLSGVGEWFAPPGIYRFLGMARDVRTGQTRIVYEDDDGMFVTGMEDWARRFTLMEDHGEPVYTLVEPDLPMVDPSVAGGTDPREA